MTPSIDEARAWLGCDRFHDYDMIKSLAALLDARDKQTAERVREQAAKAQCVACRNGMPFDGEREFHIRPNGSILVCASERIRKMPIEGTER